jgi:hypothetical protein
MIRKGQMHDDGFAKTAAEQFYSLVILAILSKLELARPARLIATQPFNSHQSPQPVGHIERQSDGILHSSLVSEATLARCAFAVNSALKKPAISC